MHYTEGHGGQGETAAYFNVEITSVKKWIRAYLKHGLEGLKRKRAHTPYEEKLKIVLASINDVNARIYGPFRHFIITDWRGAFGQHPGFAFFL